ncbi:InlB B-repeat-containing protein [Paenibacillus septentrionalis]|uniref:InlB B-repeat-containing protein n=1 Tax=Paenibacillus septentrionalis TaxID=429342 RepID=UPI003630C62C
MSNATYSINNGDAVNFEHDEIITVPVTKDDEPIIVLVGSQVNGESITSNLLTRGLSLMNAPPVEESTHVNVYLSINRNEDFQALAGSNIYTYTFNPELFGGWPGNTPMTRMKYNGNDTHWYKIVMPRAAVGGIIFNNNAGSQTGHRQLLQQCSIMSNCISMALETQGLLSTMALTGIRLLLQETIRLCRQQCIPSGTQRRDFQPSGGSPIDTQYVREGGKATRPTTDPTRDGYIFDGKWYTEADFQNEYDFSTPVVNTLVTIISMLDSLCWMDSGDKQPRANYPPVNPGPISPPSSNPEPSAPAQPDVVKDGDKAIC